MQKKEIIVIIASVIIIGCFVGFYFLYQNLGPSSSQAPDYELESVSGKQFSISSIQPKILLLDFMSVTCTPCKAMNPILNAIYEDNQFINNLSIISVEIDPFASRQQLLDYKTEHNISWDIVFSVEGMKEDYDVDSLPTFVIVNSKGKITLHHEGLITEDNLRNTLIDTLENDIDETAITKQSGFIIGIAIITAIASFFSPCAFPLMPSYMAHILGQKTEKEEKKQHTIEEENLKETKEHIEEKNKPIYYAFIGSVGGIGILTSYGLLGLLIIIVGNSIKKYIPYLIPIIGGILIILGILMFTNFALQFTKIQKWINKRQIRARDKKKTRAQQTFFYGVGYGLASLGCNAPIFFAFALQVAALDNLVKIILAFLSFILTIVFLMALATVLISLSRDLLLEKLKRSTDIIKKISGATILSVGIYLLLEFFLSG